MIKEFIRQCPACQVMNRMRLQIKTHRFTCASYNPFEVLNIGPLTKDPTGWMNVYHGIIQYTPPTGRSNKLLPKHKGPYQVLGREQSIYITEDLVRDKQI